MSAHDPSFQGPVVIGGVGGSGTRVIAQILIDLGFYMGSDLNVANDNLWFSLLVRRPHWFFKQVGDREQLFKGLAIFERAMLGRLEMRSEEAAFILRAVGEGMFPKRMYPQLWLLRPAMTLAFGRQTDLSAHKAWGWKEPNSHIFLEYLSEYFGSLKYVHLIRHGLDMAYGQSKGQIELWGEFFGIDIPQAPGLRPKATLNYWIRSNERAIQLGNRLLGERFLLLDFDELCAAPRKGVQRLVDFLGTDVSETMLGLLASLIKTPKSKGRYKQHNLSLFSKEELNAVRRFGFEV
jgi:hypothetical protein